MAISKLKKIPTPAVIKMIKNMDPKDYAIKDAGINLLSDICLEGECQRLI